MKTKHTFRGAPGMPHKMITIAILMAMTYSEPPTVEHLMARYDMSRATAYRWRAAFIEAKRLRDEQALARGQVDDRQMDLLEDARA